MMIKIISEDLSFILVKNHIVSEKDREITIYGIQLILTSLFTIISILAVGILLRKIAITLTFLVSFMSIRSYSGGYHANQYWKCYFISCMTYLTIILLVLFTTFQIRQVATVLIIGITYISILKMSPLNSHKNPKTEKQMQTRKWKTRFLISLYSAMTLVGITFLPSQNELWFTLALTQLTVTISLMITLLQRRYFK